MLEEICQLAPIEPALSDILTELYIGEFLARQGKTKPMKFKNVTAVNNGIAGISVLGNPAGLEFENVHVEGNGVAGILLQGSLSLPEYLGLNGEVDPKDLADLLRALQGKGELDRHEAAVKHSFVRKYSKQILDISTFFANVANISEPVLAAVLTHLSK